MSREGERVARYLYLERKRCANLGIPVPAWARLVPGGMRTEEANLPPRPKPRPVGRPKVFTTEELGRRTRELRRKRYERLRNDPARWAKYLETQRLRLKRKKMAAPVVEAPPPAPPTYVSVAIVSPRYGTFRRRFQIPDTKKYLEQCDIENALNCLWRDAKKWVSEQADAVERASSVEETVNEILRARTCVGVDKPKEVY